MSALNRQLLESVGPWIPSDTDAEEASRQLLPPDFDAQLAAAQDQGRHEYRDSQGIHLGTSQTRIATDYYQYHFHGRFMVSLRHRFEDPFLEEQVRVQLQPGEPLGGRLWGRIPPTHELPANWPERIFIHMFKDGLNPEILQWVLVSGDPDSLMGWICLAGDAKGSPPRGPACQVRKGSSPRHPTTKGQEAAQKGSPTSGETV
uniref:Uncharacterized protein n=1 Tax=Sphaerodactylus townsendi TaxID=933632 RepID=A0ACB8E6B6_9SAUR